MMDGVRLRARIRAALCPKRKETSVESVRNVSTNLRSSKY